MSGSLCPITLHRDAVESYITENLQGYRLKVECTDSQCSDKGIFVYLATMADPVSGDVTLIFQSIASLGDLAEYPLYTTGMTLEVGNFYRKENLDLLFRSQDLLQSTWEAIKSDVSVLAHTLSYAEDVNLNSPEDVVLTDFPTPYNGSIDLRSGIFFGTGSNEYTVAFIPAFKVPPIVTASPSREIRVWIDTVTASSVKFMISEPLLATDKVSWVAVG